MVFRKKNQAWRVCMCLEAPPDVGSEVSGFKEWGALSGKSEHKNCGRVARRWRPVRFRIRV